jgi:putative salt-induced outer membrane protein YdiY
MRARDTARSLIPHPSSLILLFLGILGTPLASRSAAAQDVYGEYSPAGGQVHADYAFPPLLPDGGEIDAATFDGPGFRADPSMLGHPPLYSLPPVEVLPPGATGGLSAHAAPPRAGELPVPPAPADPVVVEAKPEPAPRLWKGSFELGLDGSEGNSTTFNIHSGVNAKRKTDQDVLSLDLDYRKNTTDSEETAHRAFFDWRYEWLFEESPWTWFGHGTVDYDEFQAFDVRVSIDAGLGYEFIDTEATSFLGRCGGGWSREIGGPDDDFVPEAVLGLDFEHQLSKRQKLTATVDYMPDVTDPDDFRLKSKAAWEMLLDAEMNLSLKVSALDRYDSTPHGAKPNDVDYSITLLWKF